MKDNQKNYNYNYRTYQIRFSIHVGQSDQHGRRRVSIDGPHVITGSSVGFHTDGGHVEGGAHTRLVGLGGKGTDFVTFVDEGVPQS